MADKLHGRGADTSGQSVGANPAPGLQDKEQPTKQILGMQPVGKFLNVCFIGKVTGYGVINGKLFYQLATEDATYDIFPEQTAKATNDCLASDIDAHFRELGLGPEVVQAILDYADHLASAPKKP